MWAKSWNQFTLPWETKRHPQKAYIREDRIMTVSNLAPTRLASPSMFNVPITFVFIVCQTTKVWVNKTINHRRLGFLEAQYWNNHIFDSLLYSNKLGIQTHLYWIVFVEDRRSRASKMVYLINLNQQWLSYICMKKKHQFTKNPKDIYSWNDS